jgi:hypothetical protein
VWIEIKRDAQKAGFIVQAPSGDLHIASMDTLSKVIANIVDDPDQPEKTIEPATNDLRTKVLEKVGSFLQEISYRDSGNQQ